MESGGRMVSVLAVILSCAAFAEVPEAARQPVSTAEIERAVRELGHDDFATRRRATYLLWQAGEAADPALREALQSPDPEVVSRARWVLERLRFGLSPDTPPQLAQLIDQFRYGNEAAQREVLKRLTDSGRVELAVRLIRSDPDSDSRERLTGWLVGDVGKNARQLILEGNLPLARQMLEIAAQSEPGYRDFAAFLLLQGELDAEIASRSERLERQPAAQEAQLLGYLFRAKGDLRAALRLFDDQAEEPSAARGVLAELGDWKELAQRLDGLPNRGDDPFDHRDDDNLERLAMAAAVYQLAGNDALHASALERLRETAAGNAADAWRVGEAMLIMGLPDEAIRLFVEHGHRQSAFELLVAQLLFDEAFQLAGMEKPGDPFYLKVDEAEAANNEEVQQEGAEADEPVRLAADVSAERFTLGLSVAQTLHRLGRAAEAEQLFDRLADASVDNPELHLHSVCAAEREVGLDERAFRRAAGAIDEQSAAALLRALFPRHAGEALRWWSYLADMQPEAGAAERLARIRDVVEKTLGTDDLLALAREAEEHLEAVPPEIRAQWLIAVGELRLVAGDTDGGRRCFQRAAKEDRSADAFARLADFHFSQRQWPAAAEAYETATHLAVGQTPESVAHLVYLQGYARTMTGDEDEGKRLMTVARLLPLGSARVRHALAEALKQRGLPKETARQWQIVLRTGRFNEWALNDAAKQLGNAISGAEPLRAASYWQRLLLSCLKRNASLAKADGYLKLVQLVHRLRTRALLETGDTEEAVREAWRAHAAMPGDTQLVCDLVPRLDHAGLDAEADRMFEAAFAHRQQAGKHHPNAPSLMNNTAWMAATCNRRLDEALDLARGATELSPDNPTYLDTLAEVHFRRGDRAEAVELIRRCMELDPDREHYQQQLARFEEAEP